MIKRLISAWMVALAGGLLLPLMSLAAVSSTTCDTPSTTTTAPVTIAEHASVVEMVSGGETALRSMSSGQSWSLLGLSRISDAPKSGTKSFRHYGYAEDAPKFKGGLREGSYATHAKGRPMHGSTAQQKLALPHEQPPNAYYKVKVGPDVPVNGPSPVQPTTVPPRPGGGVEYTFPKGTPPGSVEGPFPIP